MHHLLEKINLELHRQVNKVPDLVVKRLMNYSWPGNVRELENCIKRAVIMAEVSVIGADELGLPAVSDADQHLNLRQVRDDAERYAIQRALARANGNLSKSAELLGISRPTLYELLDKLGLRQT